MQTFYFQLIPQSPPKVWATLTYLQHRCCKETARRIFTLLTVNKGSKTVIRINSFTLEILGHSLGFANVQSDDLDSRNIMLLAY